MNIPEFIAQYITGKDAETIASEIYDDSGVSPTGTAEDYNNAVNGPDVKDGIVGMVLLLKAYLGLTRENLTEINELAELVDIEDGTVVFPGDVKIVGVSVLTKLARKLSGDYRDAVKLTADDDLDTLEQGTYYVATAAIADAIYENGHGPVASAPYMLYVINTTGSGRWRQIAVVNTTPTLDTSGLYTRNGLDTLGYGQWKRIATIKELRDSIDALGVDRLYPGQIMQVLNRHGNITNSVYSAGALDSATGAISDSTASQRKYIRSPAYPITDDMYVCASCQVVYAVYAWAGSVFAGKTGLLTGTVNIREAVAGIAYSGDGEIDAFKVVCRFADERESETILDDLSAHLYLMQQGGASFVPFSPGGIDKLDGSDTDTTERQSHRARTGMLTETDCLVSPSPEILYSVFFYDADGAYIGCLLNRATADCIGDIMPDRTAGWRLMVRRKDNGSLTNTYPRYHTYYGALARVYRGTTTEYLRHKLAVDTGGEDIYRPVTVQWERRVIASATGLPANSTTRISTPIEINVDTRIDAADGYKFAVYYYGQGGYIGWSNWQTGHRDVALMDTTPEEATSIKLVAAKSDDATITSLSEASDNISIYLRGGRYESIDDLISTYVHDIPPHIGVLNAILNFKQLTDIEYTAMAKLPKLPDSDDPTNPDKNYAPAGTVIQGMVYSSSRVYGGFVPTAVSLHTFMSAAKSPHSYLYTVDLSKPPYNNRNGKTYYGAVCSVACSYALGLPHGYSTYQWPYIPGMEVIDASTAYDLRLGDTIVTNEGGHVMLVTDILRNKRGRIAYVTISEAANNVYGVCRSTSYTPEKIKASYLDKNYIVCRYSYINQVNHEVSPFVAVEDEVVTPYVYPPVIPRKGDRSNYKLGEEIVIDILDGTGYTAYKLFKDGAWVGSSVPLSGDTITPEISSAGMYSIVLTDGDNDSDPCNFAVVDYGFSVTVEGRTVTANISCSANAAPYEIVFVIASGNSGFRPSTVGGVAYIADIAAGQTEFSLPAYNVYPAGPYGVRIGFKTEYGILYSDVTSISIS